MSLLVSGEVQIKQPFFGGSFWMLSMSFAPEILADVLWIFGMNQGTESFFF